MEVFAIWWAIRTLGRRQESGRRYTVFVDSTSTIDRVRTVRGQLWTQADWGWPGPTVVGLASTVGLAIDGPTSTVGPG